MQERPVTVTIFGILNIGFGVMELGGALMSGLFENMGSLATNPNLNSIAAFMDALHKDSGYIWWNRITRPLEVVAGLALIAAGIGLLRLKNWARLTSIGCAIYKIIFSLGTPVVLVLALRGVLANLIKSGGPLLTYVVIAGVVVGLFGLLVSLAYPVLLIFFLTRPKVLPAFAPPGQGTGGTSSGL